ncbi:MAG: fused MFS/spermidine synthase, partial [Burkholderiales bacterium]|nr:fused MFS/spermidine synthase [Burkholderiales bacterium]
KPEGDDDPSFRILGLLFVTIGLPYFLLSTTGPLVQAWFARTFPAGTVYRLFALSNFGSLLALVSYPVAVEPWITSSQQSWGWTAGYVLFVVLCATAALFSLRSQSRFAGAAETVAAVNDGPAPGVREYLLWLVLSAMGSFMLLAVTNHITHDVASVPFLWILPLTIYLVTFILCFEGRGWYQRYIFFGPLLVIVCTMAWGLHHNSGIMDIKAAIPLYSIGLFICCMFFHGELANMKPAPRYLTAFYLMVALGGALGGAMIGFVAPKFFNSYYEFGIGLIVTLGLAAYSARRMHITIPMLAIAAIGFASYQAAHYINLLSKDARVMTRNFYGTLRVKDTGPETDNEAVRRLMHGVIMHGEQYLAPARRAEPTTYYGPTAGIGVAIAVKQGEKPVRIGVVGLGAGTLATYGRPGDVYRFYEINPDVIDVARTEFFFLGDSRAQVETVLGDARLAMERENPQQYDVLAIDAFSSDSIPVHLITREAMAVYLRHVKPDGIIAFHVTNRFLRLAPVVKSIADEYGLRVSLVIDDAEDSDLASTDWVLVTRDPALLERPEIARSTYEIARIPGLRLWTDDFNNLFQILK